MKRLITAFFAFVVMISFAFPTMAQNLCGERVDIIDTLKKRYHEVPVSMGLAGNGGVVEIFASTKGSWTIIVTRPTGVACVVSAGEAWESLKGIGDNDQGV
jgi:predicted benzoate:H+ symporter BenE